MDSQIKGEPEYAILNDDHTIRITNDVLEWARFFDERERRRVARDELGDDILVSTVFLGLDHGWDGKPMWFETMVFCATAGSDWLERYETWDEAVIGHQMIVAAVKAQLDGTANTT